MVVLVDRKKKDLLWFQLLDGILPLLVFVIEGKCNGKLLLVSSF